MLNSRFPPYPIEEVLHSIHHGQQQFHLFLLQSCMQRYSPLGPGVLHLHSLQYRTNQRQGFPQGQYPRYFLHRACFQRCLLDIQHRDNLRQRLRFEVELNQVQHKITRVDCLQSQRLPMFGNHLLQQSLQLNLQSSFQYPYLERNEHR